MEKKNSKKVTKNKTTIITKKRIVISIIIFIGLIICNSIYFKNNYEEICFEYDSDNGKYGVTIYGYKCDFIKDVTIPDTINAEEVTEIADYVFYNKKIKSVKLPNNIRKIGNKSFANNSIKEIYIPYSTEYIGDYAFAENSIGELNLQINLQYLGNHSFIYNSIENLRIESTKEKGLTKIGNSAFEGNSLRNVILPNTLIEIGSNAFAENELMDSIYIPANVKKIDYCAFCNTELSEIINGPKTKFDWNGILTTKQGEPFKTGSVNIIPCDEELTKDCNIYTEIKTK